MKQKELYDLTIDNLMVEDDAKWEKWFDSLSEEDQKKVGKFIQQIFKSPPQDQKSEG
jgi:uncharacterized protein with von Willebrand factor type A (vWA) domain